MITVFSENPEGDLWRELLQYTYEANVKRYFKKNGIKGEEKTINCITGSFLQASEYFKSAKDANLQIAPLLLYYGSSNLLYGMTNLKSGTINEINSHGMKTFPKDDMKFIAETVIRFNSPKDGGVHVFARALGYETDLTGYGEWSLNEFLDSIAEINTEYTQCYDESCSKVIMLDVFHTPDELTVEKVYFTEDNKASILNLLSNVENIKKSYLPITQGRIINSEKEYYILRHKMVYDDICEKSYSGQPYLRSAHNKNGKIITLPTILNLYISLFALASLCRYSPEYWSPFVLKDNTGEKLLIEKFLYFARRMIPNIVLNKLLKDDVQYTSNKYKTVETVKYVGEHQVKELVGLEVNKRIEKMTLENRVKK